MEDSQYYGNHYDRHHHKNWLIKLIYLLVVVCGLIFGCCCYRYWTTFVRVHIRLIQMEQFLVKFCRMSKFMSHIYLFISSKTYDWCLLMRYWHWRHSTPDSQDTRMKNGVPVVQDMNQRHRSTDLRVGCILYRRFVDWYHHSWRCDCRSRVIYTLSRHLLLLTRSITSVKGLPRLTKNERYHCDVVPNDGRPLGFGSMDHYQFHDDDDDHHHHQQQ